jgi:hypothetical protein
VDTNAAAAERATAARAFEVVWNTLVGVLGTAATATLLRRAARSAAARRPELPELHGFQVLRDGLDYRFVLPPSWSSEREDCLRTVRHLVREELRPLLEELTGPVVVRLLERQPELQRSGIVEPRREER